MEIHVLEILYYKFYVKYGIKKLVIFLSSLQIYRTRHWKLLEKITFLF